MSQISGGTSTGHGGHSRAIDWRGTASIGPPHVAGPRERSLFDKSWLRRRACRMQGGVHLPRGRSGPRSHCGLWPVGVFRFVDRSVTETRVAASRSRIAAGEPSRNGRPRGHGRGLPRWRVVQGRAEASRWVGVRLGQRGARRMPGDAPGVSRPGSFMERGHCPGAGVGRAPRGSRVEDGWLRAKGSAPRQCGPGGDEVGRG